VQPGRPVLITGQIVATGATVNMLSAKLDDFTLHPDRSERYINVDAIDALGQLKGVSVTTALYQALRPGEAIGVLLDAIGWPAALRDLDVGATVMPYWWLDGDDAFDALMDLVYSEGPPALVSCDGQGRIVFRGRHHRLLNTVSTTVQSTWRSGGSLEPLFSAPTDYNHGWKEIVNSISFQVPIRQVDASPSTVWSSSGQLGIASGDTLAITAQGTEPFLNAQIPVAGTDFTLVSGTVTVSLSKTSGLSTTISVQALGGPAVIADLSLRANSVSTVTTVQVTATDPVSITKYGVRSLPSGRDPKWPSLPDANAICGIILAQRGDRLPTISVTMVAANTTRLTQQLTRNLSDRVHVIESHSGLDADCFIERISHSIAQGGAEHTTTFGLEKSPMQITGAFVLGSATSGVLGTNRLGRRSTANAATVFILGSGTNGVLGTNVLAP